MQILVIDDVAPEANAMLQALYSRSADSVKDHLDIVRSRGAEKFMSSYYVGYGHASIGDCGQTTSFIENVSLLACKAIQDNPLYSGQETSTRYIDFSKQSIINPTPFPEFSSIQRSFLSFYLKAYENVFLYLKEKFPCTESSKQKVWEKTLNARAFDIARGFLPAGVASQLSWISSLRQANEGITRLSHHPLEEVRTIATQLNVLMMEKYPSSFNHQLPDNVDTYNSLSLGTCAYADENTAWKIGNTPQIRSTFDYERLNSIDRMLLTDRPRKAQLPRHLSKYGRFNLTFELDFGSFRDLQRHRNGFCAMPLLTEKLGFNKWYLEQLPPRFRGEAETFLAKQIADLNEFCLKHDVSEVDKQYALPIGMNVLCELDYDLPQLVYVTELRSGTTVHPTLRFIMHDVHKFLSEHFGALALYTNLTQDGLDIRRGAQDIVRLENQKEVA